MKRNNLFTTLVAIATLIVCTMANAQNAARDVGTIEGRVLNVTNGQYLNNARVTVQGSALTTFTDQGGYYRISGVPAGSATVRVFYTGFPERSSEVTVAAGQVATADFRLSSNAQKDDRGADTVTLDPFVISSQRETNASNIATNEQRFAANIKNVVASDAFGDVTEGNVGEFVKYLPGVTVDYVAADVRTISVRGFADNFTNVTTDGAKMASSASGSATRTFELEQVSINNVSRIEVSKVPMPEQAADSLGGAVNMISRSAFESARKQFRYRLYMSMNSEDTDIFSRTPGPHKEETYKVLPGFDFNYIAPLTKNFGLVVNGLTSNQFNEQHRTAPSWAYTGAGTLTAPYMRNYSMQDGPKTTHRHSGSVKADWRPLPGHVLSASVQGNYYYAYFGNRNINFDAGSNAVSATPGGANLSFDPTFTHGATGRGVVTQGSNFSDKYGATWAGGLTHRFNGREWEIDSGFNISKSKYWRRAGGRGHFSAVNTSLQGVSRVLYDDFSHPEPGRVTAVDAAGNPIDIRNPANFRITTLTDNPSDAKDEIKEARLNIKRNLDVLPFPSSLKIGGLVQRQNRDMQARTTNYTFVGPDGIANTADDSMAGYFDTKYIVENSYGFNNLVFADLFKLWDTFQANPNYIRPTAAQTVTSERNRINGSRNFQETITAAYAQWEARFWQNRFRVVTGVRYEKTHDIGYGALMDPDAVYQRDATGRFVLVNGARVRLPQAGAAGSLEELALTNKERGAYANTTYDGYYPSLHTTFNVTDNLLLRFAYAKTFGRPNLGDIIPNTTIDENDDPDPPAGAPIGEISVVNSGLKPYSADNYDLSLEYYMPKGGVVSVGAFRKDLSDFFGTITTVATAPLLNSLGLDDRYVGWNVRTRINIGEAQVDGAEFNVMQPLYFIPRWGQYLNFSASGSVLHLQGAEGASFQRFIPKSGNLGLTFSRKPIVLRVKWNYRGRQRLDRQTGIAPNAWSYYDSRENIDINAEYQFNKRVTVFASARNILNVPQDQERYSPDTPGYSKITNREQYGVQYSFGIRGEF